jgi:catechol 2,3-dioxygenase-like lactoylglutathione lyase family enzyme
MDYQLQLIAIRVTDVDRAKAFYADQVGFAPDHDHTVSEELRFVQLTPPGSACSITIGTGVTGAAPGSAQGMLLVVSDIDAARAELAERGVPISEVEEVQWGSRHAFFQDPDGNGWSLQEGQLAQ